MEGTVTADGDLGGELRGCWQCTTASAPGKHCMDRLSGGRGCGQTCGWAHGGRGTFSGWVEEKLVVGVSPEAHIFRFMAGESP